MIVTHSFEHSVELGSFGQPFRLQLRHHREGPVEEAQRPVDVKLGSARGHSIGKLALRFHVARQLGSRVLQVLHIDGEARDGSR